MRHPLGPYFQNADPAAPAGGGSFRGNTCDFCGCNLAADGGVLKMSTRARELARIEEKIEKITADLAAAKADATELRTQLAAANARPAPVRDDDDDEL